MKILLVGFTKLSRMPYVNFYLDAMANTDHEIHLLYWNRDGGIPEGPIAAGVNAHHEFRCVQEDQVAKLTKIPAFLRYRRYVKRLLREHSFDLLVVLHTLPGLILLDELMWKYRRSYVLDFRDVTFERILPFRWLVERMARNSTAVFVSSNAFRSFLPRMDKIFTSHNLDPGLLGHREIRRRSTRQVSPLRVRYWGLIRHVRVNRQVIDQLGNDARFELHYHGVGGADAEALKRHVRERGVSNVHFHGSYRPEERYAFASETDILLNLYENDATMAYAMGNKFYDGIALYLPQLCAAGSYMGERVTGSRVGLEIDPLREGFSESVFDYYRHIHWAEFEAHCDQELSGVLEEYQDSSRAIVCALGQVSTSQNRLC